MVYTKRRKIRLVDFLAEITEIMRSRMYKLSIQINEMGTQHSYLHYKKRMRTTLTASVNNLYFDVLPGFGHKKEIDPVTGCVNQECFSR